MGALVALGTTNINQEVNQEAEQQVSTNPVNSKFSELPTTSNPDERQTKTPRSPSPEAQNFRLDYESSLTSGFISYHVQHFPLIIINIRGIGTFCIHVGDFLSEL